MLASACAQLDPNPEISYARIEGRKRNYMRLSNIARLGTFALLLSSSTFASDFDRTGTFEVGGILQWYEGDTVDAHIRDRSGDLEMDDLFGGGISFGYNIIHQLNVNTEFVYSSTDVRFSGPDFDFRDDVDFWAWTVNLEYYILPTRFTPYVTAGIGLLSLYNDYRDDWYYYYYYPSDREVPMDEVNFLWNVGAGVRWDTPANLYLKAGYRFTGSEMEHSSDQLLMHSVFLVIGYNFSN